MRVSPSLLYPTISFNLLEKGKLDETITAIKNGYQLPPIQVIEFESCYYILAGHYIMLANCIAGKNCIDIEVLDYKMLDEWNTVAKIKENIEAISISTVYDFEGIGGFTYDVYPPYYRR